MTAGLTVRALVVSVTLSSAVVPVRVDGQDPHRVDPSDYTVMLSSQQHRRGTGFIIGDRLNSLYIATAAHLFTDPYTPCPQIGTSLPYKVFLRNQEISHEGVTLKYCTEDQFDLAVLEVKIPASSFSLEEIPHSIMASTLRPKLDKVRFFGNFSSGTTQEYHVRDMKNGLLPVETDIVPLGASGGPLINACGHLVAMAVEEANDPTQDKPSIEAIVDRLKDLEERQGFALDLVPAPGPCKRLAPERPIGLNVKMLSLSEVELSWQDLPNEEGYYIEQVYKNGGGTVTPIRTEKNENTIKTELDPGGIYQFSVSGWNEGVSEQEALKAFTEIRMFPETKIRFSNAAPCQDRWITREKSVDVIVETDASFKLQVSINGIASTFTSQKQENILLDPGVNPLSIEFEVDTENQMFEILAIPDGVQIVPATDIDGAVVSEQSFELRGRVLVPGINHPVDLELFPQAKIALHSIASGAEPHFLTLDPAGYFQDPVPLGLGVNRLKFAVDDCQGVTTNAHWPVYRILPSAPRLSHQWSPELDQLWPEAIIEPAQGAREARNELRRLLLSEHDVGRGAKQALVAQASKATLSALELPDGSQFKVFTSEQGNMIYAEVSGHEELLLRGNNLSVTGDLTLVGGRIAFAGSFSGELENWIGKNQEIEHCPAKEGCSFLAFIDEQRNDLKIADVLEGVRVHHLSAGFNGLLLASTVETPRCSMLNLEKEAACLAAVEGASTYIIHYDLQGLPIWATAPPITGEPVSIVSYGDQGMLVLSRGVSQHEEISMASYFNAGETSRHD